MKKKIAAALRKVASWLSPVPNSFIQGIDIEKLGVAYEYNEIELHQRSLLISYGHKTKEYFIERDQRRIEESIFKAIREKGLIQLYRRYDEATRTEVISGELLVGVKKV